MYSGILRKSDWTIENCRFDKPNERYLPGDNMTLSFDFKSHSYSDMYVANIGIQTDWMIMDGRWYYQPINNFIKPGQRRSFTFSFPIRDRPQKITKIKRDLRRFTRYSAYADTGNDYYHNSVNVTAVARQ